MDLIRFLEDHCIKLKRSNNKLVHNLLFKKYIMSDDPEVREQLIESLNKIEQSGNQGQGVFLEMIFAWNLTKR